MQTLVQARKNNLAAGEPIWNPHAVLYRAGAHIRRGNVTLIVAGPGTGKSALVQHWLQVGNRAGGLNRTLYFSADSDAGTMHNRAAAIATGLTTEEVEKIIREGDAIGIDDAVARATRHMQFQYESSPDEDSVAMEIDAYATLWGAYPEVVVMDNLKNLYVPGGDEWQALENAVVFLQVLAKETNAAVIIPHHALGEYDDGLRPIPLGGIRGKVSKTPELILTLHRNTSTYLGISPVKNRSGPADPSGKTFYSIPADLTRMSFG